MNLVVAKAMLRGGGLPGLVAGVVVALAALGWGRAEALGAMVGALTGLVAMALPAVVLLAIGRWNPALVTLAGMSLYSLVLAGIWAVRSWVVVAEGFSSVAAGVDLAATVLAWSLGMMLALRSARLPIWDRVEGARQDI